ncbi:zwei Ig domain protein zig-8-like [Bombyx mandarina]|uniref:Zwei Ig domain protein zig-8-like n=1 Tax=Bombyx mandarina TaxID=7092 RepID=A0A6J2JC34_BOMMA|nr:zwei Ig domain protein zig-8-like [Bombyx mandarina]
MCACVRLLMLAALPTLAGISRWCADGEVVSVTEGTGPAFAPRQRDSLIAAVGQTAALECRVLRLGDKSVSWVRSSDLQILSHAGSVFTADARVSATSSRGGSGSSRHTLRIERLRTTDAGRYECQVNMEPKMSKFFNLTVLDEPIPVPVLKTLREVMHGTIGSAVTLTCEARYDPPPGALPLPPLEIRWQKGDQLINLQTGRGGVSLDTERWTGGAISRLTLGALRRRDSGRYSCTVLGHSATISLTVDDQPSPIDAMQRDETAVAQVGSGLTIHQEYYTTLAILFTHILMR